MGPRRSRCSSWARSSPLLAVVSDGAYALLAGAAGGWLRTSRRARGWLAKASGGVYIGLGITAALAGGHSRPSNG